MTNRELSTLFTDNYEDLRVYAIRAIKYLKINIEVEEVLSETYLHIQLYVDEIDTENKLVSYSKNFIKCNLNWWNSPVRRQSRGRQHGELHDGLPSRDTQELPSEEQINEWTRQFITKLSTLDKRLFNIYTILDKRRGHEVANHLCISISGAYTYINAAKLLEDQYREYIKSQCI